MLLRGAKFETGETFSPVQTGATLLAYNSRNCWESLRPFARSLRLQNSLIYMRWSGMQATVKRKVRAVNHSRGQRESVLQLAIRANCSWHVLAQNSFQLAPTTFSM